MSFLQNTAPFPHSIIAPVFPSHLEDQLISRLDASQWKREVGRFYRFDVLESKAQFEALKGALEESTTVPLSREIEKSLGASLDQRFSLEVHRYGVDCG